MTTSEPGLCNEKDYTYCYQAHMKYGKEKGITRIDCFKHKQNAAEVISN